MSTSQLKPSADEILYRKAKGDFNLYNRAQPREWRSCSKRVDEYHSRERKDDANLKRGAKMVDHFRGYEDPIVLGDESNLYEKAHLKVLVL